MRTRRTRKIF